MNTIGRRVLAARRWLRGTLRGQQSWASEAGKDNHTDYGSRTARAAAKNGSKTPVVQIDPATLKVLAEYPGQTAAAKATGIRVSCINACLRGKQKRAGGFLWAYKYKKVVL